MFKRGAVSRSLHAPRGMRITELDQNPRVKRKMSWSSPKVRSAASEGVLTHNPVTLKEGFLYKPAFLRLVRKIKTIFVAIFLYRSYKYFAVPFFPLRDQKVL